MKRAIQLASVVILWQGASAASASDCPEARKFDVAKGPASWPTKYGIDGTCIGSAYDCRMPTTDPDFRRYENADDKVDGAWPVAMGIPVVDGRAVQIGTVTLSTTKLNWGQRKTLQNKQYVYAFSVGNGADDVSGWVPAACIGWDGKNAPSASCMSSSTGTPKDFPVFNGRKPEAKYDAIEKVELATPTQSVAQFPSLLNVDLDSLKIICNAPNEAHRSIADYMARTSNDGTYYTINLLANVPGVHPALGGIASDTFRITASDHVTFHRLIHVKTVRIYMFKAGTTQGAPSEGSNVQFGYGYITYPTGSGWARRYGWLPNYATRVPG